MPAAALTAQAEWALSLTSVPGEPALPKGPIGGLRVFAGPPTLGAPASQIYANTYVRFSIGCGMRRLGAIACCSLLLIVTLCVTAEAKHSQPAGLDESSLLDAGGLDADMKEVDSELAEDAPSAGDKDGSDSDGDDDDDSGEKRSSHNKGLDEASEASMMTKVEDEVGETPDDPSVAMKELDDDSSPSKSLDNGKADTDSDDLQDHVETDADESDSMDMSLSLDDPSFKAVDPDTDNDKLSDMDLEEEPDKKHRHRRHSHANVKRDDVNADESAESESESESESEAEAEGESEGGGVIDGTGDFGDDESALKIKDVSLDEENNLDATAVKEANEMVDKSLEMGSSNLQNLSSDDSEGDNLIADASAEGSDDLDGDLEEVTPKELAAAKEGEGADDDSDEGETISEKGAKELLSGDEDVAHDDEVVEGDDVYGVKAQRSHHRSRKTGRHAVRGKSSLRAHRHAQESMVELSADHHQSHHKKDRGHHMPEHVHEHHHHKHTHQGVREKSHHLPESSLEEHVTHHKSHHHNEHHRHKRHAKHAKHHESRHGDVEVDAEMEGGETNGNTPVKKTASIVADNEALLKAAAIARQNAGLVEE